MAGKIFDDCAGGSKCIIERLAKEGLKPEVGDMLKKALEQDAGKKDAR